MSSLKNIEKCQSSKGIDIECDKWHKDVFYIKMLHALYKEIALDMFDEHIDISNHPFVVESYLDHYLMRQSNVLRYNGIAIGELFYEDNEMRITPTDRKIRMNMKFIPIPYKTE